jgi:hypothetical protein
VSELRDSAIWAATCTLKAQVLQNAGRPLLVRSAAPGAAVVVLGLVALSVVPVVGVLLVGFGLLPVLAGAVVSRRPGHLMLEADGFTYRAVGGRTVGRAWTDCGGFRAVQPPLGLPGHVAWAGRGGAPGGAFLPGAGGLPAEDLAVLLGRYRDRFAPDPGSPESPESPESPGPSESPGSSPA